jgi:3-oxoacyl-[acyl-carrier protein] reductase
MAGTPSYPDLAGTVCLVTGGSRGIGAVSCRLFAAAGAAVAVGGRDRDAIDRVVADVERDGGRAVPAPGDCTDAAAVERMCREVERELGPVEVLLAFAGGGGDPAPTASVTPERWREVVEGNLTATFLTVRCVLPGMVERREGAIVTMGSTAGRLAGGAAAPYAAAKAGVLMFTRHVANEVARHGVRVNAVAPGAVMSEERRARLPEQALAQAVSTVPLGRLGTPEDVGLAALFLASSAASWLTGVTLDVTGGRIML